MESSIKNLRITGVAATLGDTVKPRRKKGISRKKPSESIEQENEGTVEGHITPVKPIISKIVPPVAVQTPSHMAAAVLQVNTLPTPLLAPLPTSRQPLFTTGTQKVNLIPPKSPKVKLNPKIIGSDKTTENHISSQQTRKARRVIVPNLSARFTRAKKLREETAKRSIETIRNYLIEKGVIQSKSKAPEKMLRSMYNDFNLLKDGQAL